MSESNIFKVNVMDLVPTIREKEPFNERLK